MKPFPWLKNTWSTIFVWECTISVAIRAKRVSWTSCEWFNLTCLFVFVFFCIQELYSSIEFVIHIRFPHNAIVSVMSINKKKQLAGNLLYCFVFFLHLLPAPSLLSASWPWKAESSLGSELMITQLFVLQVTVLKLSSAWATLFKKMVLQGFFSEENGCI